MHDLDDDDDLLDAPAVTAKRPRVTASSFSKSPPPPCFDDDDDDGDDDDELSFAKLLKSTQQDTRRRDHILSQEAAKDEDLVVARMFANEDETPEEEARIDEALERAAQRAEKDSRPPPLGFFQSSISTSPIGEAPPPGLSRRMRLVWGVFFSETREESSRMADELEEAATSLMEEEDEEEESAVCEMFAVLRSVTGVKEDNVRRGLRALVASISSGRRRMWLAQECVEFACWPNSLRCELELSRLLHAALASNNNADYEDDLAQRILRVTASRRAKEEEGEEEDETIYRWCRVGRLFTPRSLGYLAALADACETKASASASADSLAEVLLDEVQRGTAEYHRWHALLTLIEFQLRTLPPTPPRSLTNSSQDTPSETQEDTDRDRICAALAKVKKQIDQSPSPACRAVLTLLSDILRAYKPIK